MEIAPTAKPPVCRIMDYGKFKYREAKKQHEAKLKQKQIQVKEVKFRPGTDEGDYKIKLRNLTRFLEGDKAKITLRFRGREMAHQEFGVRLLERVERPGAVRRGRAVPKLEGRQMVMLLAPKKSDSAKASNTRDQAPKRRSAGARSLSSARQRAAPPWAANKRRRIMPKMKTKCGAKKRFRVRGSGSRQARAGVQAPHPHQEDHQEQTSVARPTGVHESKQRSVRSHAALRVRR